MRERTLSEPSELIDEAACCGMLDGSLTLVAADARLLDWLGLDEADCVGQKITAVLPSLTPYLSTIESLALAQRQLCTFHDVCLPHPNRRTVEITVAPFLSSGSLLSITAVDLTLATKSISSQITLENQSWQNQASQLAMILQNVQDAIILTDEALHIQSWNRAAEQIYGWKSGEVLGKLLSDVLPTTFPEQDAEAVMRTLTDTGRWDGIMIQERKDGQSLFVQSVSRVLFNQTQQSVGLVTINRDITKRQMVEDELRQTEKRYRALFEEAPVMYATTRIDGAIISDCNLRFGQTLEYERQEIIDQSLFKFYTPASRKKAEIEGYQQALLGQFVTQERQFLTKSGRIVTTLLSASPMRDKTGRVIGTRTMYIDISQLKTTEAERERLFQELENANKRLRLLSRNQVETQEIERRRIARELHDEIGQTLTAVKLQLQSMQRVFNQTAAQEGLKESIVVVDQALVQVRDISLNLRPSLLDDFGLATTLRWYLDRQSQWAEFDAHFQTNLDDERLPSELESVCFRVVQEALTNIIRHARAEQVFITLNKHGLLLRLTIQDDGVGFDVEQARSHASRGNSLGILGMEERVMLVNGKLNIRSSAENGSLLEVQIPL